LFGEILDWMLTPLLLLWPVSLALTWLVAQDLANKPFDRALEYNAHALAQLQRPDRQVQSVCEQGNGSPTSVVTASQIGSECSDSDTSTIDIEERCPTPGVDTAEVAVQVPPTDVRQVLILADMILSLQSIFSFFFISS
jgi:hypothetical protein